MIWFFSMYASDFRSLLRIALPLCLLAVPAAGDTGPARLVADLVPGTVPISQFLSGFASVGNRTVFTRADDEHRTSLWVSDGTSQGTAALGVLCPTCAPGLLLGSTGSVAFYRVSLVNQDDPKFETRIWRTDGTPAGTFPVTEGFQAPFAPLSSLSSLAGNRLFFVACTPELGCEPWSSDGTWEGTAPVGEIVPGPGNADIQSVRDVAAAGARAFLIAGDSDATLSLWIADADAHTVKRLRGVPRARRLVALSGAGPGRVFFIGEDAQGGGLEIWTSDGTAAGTLPLTAFGPPDPFGYKDSYVFKTAAGRLWFQANDGTHGDELWSVGAAPGTLRRLTDFGDPAATVFDLQPSGGRLLFTASQRNGSKLWTSRGELRSTAPVTGCAGGCPRVASTLEPLGGGRFALFGGDRKGQGFWVTDGTGAGTRLLKRPERHYDQVQAVAAGGRALFEITSEYDIGELWITDGSPAGTFLATHGGPYWSHYYGWADDLAAGTAGGRLVFQVRTVLTTGETEALWTSDGTPAGSRPLPQAVQAMVGRSSEPRQLKPFRDGLLIQSCTGTSQELRFVHNIRTNTGVNSETTRLLSVPFEFCSNLGSVPVILGGDGGAGGVALLTAYAGGFGLWRTDGTAAGTFALVPGAAQGQTQDVTLFGGQAAFGLFTGDGNHPQTELWLTNGTPAGTRKLLDLPGVLAYQLTGIGNKLYFFVEELRGSDFVYRPWVSDGTPAGTHPLIPPTVDLKGSGLSYPEPAFLELGGRVFFRLGRGDGAVEIWSTDGTEAGTGPAITAASGMTNPRALTLAGGRLYFAARQADDPKGPFHPWVSDGTDATTELLGAGLAVQFVPFSPEDRPRFVELNGRVFFAAHDPAHGDELWSTDGTAQGTALVKDIAPGPFASYPRGLVAWQDRLWFRARDAVHGMELWSSDGSAAGTRLVQDVNPGAFWSQPLELTVTSQGLYFSANDSVHGRELWLLPAP